MSPSRLRMMALGPVLLLASVPTPAQAITQSGALNAARYGVQRFSQLARSNPIVIYGNDRPLKAGSQVWWVVPDQRGLKRPAPFRPLESDAWLFWIDTEWGAKFPHKSYVALVNDKTGKATVRATSWWPIVDGKAPPYVSWGRYDNRYQLFSTVPRSADQVLGGLPGAPFATGRAVVPVRAPAGSLAGTCVLTVGEGNIVRANGDYMGIASLTKDLAAAGTGLKSFRARGSKKEPELVTASDLEANVDALVKSQGCSEILLYIGGHASARGARGIEQFILTGVDDWSDEGKDKQGDPTWMSHQSWLGNKQLAKIVAKYPRTFFDFFVDAPGSQNFAAALRPTRRMPNVHTGVFSSANRQLAFFWLPQVYNKRTGAVPNKTDNPGNSGKPGRSEFTNGVLFGLRTFFSDTSALRNAAAVPGSSLLAQALSYAGSASTVNNLAAQTRLATPFGFSDQKLIPPGGPIATGAIRTMGSTLEQDADKALSSPEDEDFWNTFIHYCQINPNDPHCKKTRATGTVPATVPADGQILAIRVKGIAERNTSVAGAPLPLTEIHFVLLRPQPDGSVETIQSSQAFNLPYEGDINQISEFAPANFCVRAGDYIALSTEGGFDPDYYPQGVNFRVFSKTAGSQINSYTKHNGVMNGSRFTGTPTDDVELLLQWDLGTGDKATKLCPGGTA